MLFIFYIMCNINVFSSDNATNGFRILKAKFYLRPIYPTFLIIFSESSVVYFP